MAYTQKCGKSYCVRQGNTGVLLNRFKSKKKADDRVRELHKEHMPKQSNRNAAARKRNSRP